MIAPHELKDKVFTHAIRGYNPAEVEEYIDFLLEKYTELYKENASNLQKLNIVTTKYDSLASDEESIRAAIVKAQKLSEVILDTARKQADTMITEAQTRVDALVKEASDRVEREKANLESVRKAAESFRSQLCDAYATHLEYLKTVEIGFPENIERDMPTDVQLDSAAAAAVADARPAPQNTPQQDVELLTDHLDTAE